MKINIIGAGFAGVEAAAFLAGKGFEINLYEMRDKKMTEAHRTGYFAELVCSNSFKSIPLTNAHGLLKKEMEDAGSIIIKTAYEHRVPAGMSLAVDRMNFAKAITEKIKSYPQIKFINEEIQNLNEIINNCDYLIIASGPLTSEKLQKEITGLIGAEYLYFFDAASPIIDGNTIDYSKVFFQSRYDKGESDFLNAPLTKEEYDHFVEEIKKAELVIPHDFEDRKIFEGCMPIESIAARGDNTLAFGPMKPVGLIDPKTDKQPFAAVQLRSENINKTMFNIVGFQTRMKWKDQDRIFRLIPGLENATFLRYGVIHKNIFLNYPKIADKDLYCLEKNKKIYFAGQISGVEGYIESAASGLYTAYSLWARLNNKPLYLPENSIMGALQKYTITNNKNYQPMASNYGLIEREMFYQNKRKIRGTEKRKILSDESLNALNEFFHLQFGK